MKKTFLCLMLALLSSLLFPEDSITQDKAYANRSFKVYVRTMVPYSRDLEVELPEENLGSLVIAAEPYLRSYNALVENSGEIIYEEMTEAVLSFRAPEGDIYRCAGLRLFRQQFELAIPEFPVIVHNRDEANLDFPLQVYWSPLKRKIYPGEILPLILNVRYTESLDFPEEVHMAKPSVGDLDQVDLSGSIDTYDIRGKSVYAYPLQSWYYSSGEPGIQTIPGGSVTILGLERDIPSLELEVLPLPDEIKRSGAVGDFSVVTQISGDRAAQGEILTLTVRIEGTGNFHYMSFPEVRSEGFELINADEEEELTPSESGYSGYRKISYRFQAGSSSTGRIRCDSFSWINPRNGRVSSYPGESFDVEITVQNGKDSGNLSLLTPGDLERLIYKEKLYGPLRWLLLLPGLLYFLFTLFSLNERKGDWLPLLIVIPLLLSLNGGTARRAKADRAQELFNRGNITESLALYEELSEEEGAAAYLYNRAVLEYYRGRIPESERLFRTALLRLPGERTLLRGLASMERLAGLQDQYRVNWGIGAVNLNGLLLLMINAFLVILSRYLKRRSLTRLLAMATLFFLILGTGGALIALNRINRFPQGIVRSEGAPLWRIPEATAEDWLRLTQGTSFRLIAEKRGYYFIKTGYGLEGWIARDRVIPVTEEFY